MLGCVNVCNCCSKLVVTRTVTIYGCVDGEVGDDCTTVCPSLFPLPLRAGCPGAPVGGSRWWRMCQSSPRDAGIAVHSRRPPPHHESEHRSQVLGSLGGMRERREGGRGGEWEREGRWREGREGREGEREGEKEKKEEEGEERE